MIAQKIETLLDSIDKIRITEIPQEVQEILTYEGLLKIGQESSDALIKSEEKDLEYAMKKEKKAKIKKSLYYVASAGCAAVGLAAGALLCSKSDMPSGAIFGGFMGSLFGAAIGAVPFIGADEKQYEIARYRSKRIDLEAKISSMKEEASKKASDDIVREQVRSLYDKFKAIRVAKLKFVLEQSSETFTSNDDSLEITYDFWMTCPSGDGYANIVGDFSEVLPQKIIPSCVSQRKSVTRTIYVKKSDIESTGTSIEKFIQECKGQHQLDVPTGRGYSGLDFCWIPTSDGKCCRESKVYASVFVRDLSKAGGK